MEKNYTRNEILKNHNILRNNLYELNKNSIIDSNAYKIMLELLHDCEDKLFNE